MIPSLFTILNDNNTVKGLLGSSPLRVFPWGEAPPNVTKPYATYGVFSGNPVNTMGETPQIDIDGTQVDVWGLTGSSVLSVANAIRNALQTYAHMTSYENSGRDEETKLFHCRMDFDFFTSR